jgi:hypothetical protein
MSNVSFTVEWTIPERFTTTIIRYKSDAAMTRLSEVAKAAVQNALDHGEAEVTIRVRRVARGPEGRR